MIKRVRFGCPEIRIIIDTGNDTRRIGFTIKVQGKGQSSFKLMNGGVKHRMKVRRVAKGLRNKFKPEGKNTRFKGIEVMRGMIMNLCVGDIAEFGQDYLLW